MHEDDEIVKRFLSGNRQVMTEIYEKAFKNVEGYIKSNGGSSADAEDIFHNGLVQIYVKLKKDNQHVKSFYSYVFTVCRNLWRKENSKKWVTDAEVSTLESEAYNQTKFSLELDQWELYEEKFNLLSDKCKELLNMIFKKKNYRDIVVHYSYASETVARQRVFKCKARLIKLISGDQRYHQLKF